MGPAARAADTPATANLALGAPGAAATQAAGSLPPLSGEVGKVYTGFYPIHGRHVPLGAGPWTVLAQTSTKRPDSDLEVVFLGEIRGEQLISGAMLLDFQNFRAGWRSRYNACTDSYNLAATVDTFGSDGRQACWFVRNLFAKAWTRWRDRNVKMDPIERAAAGQLEVKGIRYPQDLLEVVFHTADARGALNAVYLFDPQAAAGLSSTPVTMWQHSDWFVDNISRYPDKERYEKQLEVWGRDRWREIKAVAAQPRE